MNLAGGSNKRRVPVGHKDASQRARLPANNKAGYQATDYKADFGFIDFGSPVKQKTLLDELDALALLSCKSW